MPDSKDLKDLDLQIKKTIISSQSFKRGSSLESLKNITSIHKTISSLAGHTRKLAVRFINLEKTVNNNSRKITTLKNISKIQSERISGTNIGAKLPGSSSSGVEENISAIAKSVNSIAEIMAGRKKLADDTAAYERKRAEQEKRALAESKLEKVFIGIAKTAEKIISPVKSLLDRILDFIGTVILGRIVFKIIEWFGDKNNQSKVKSIIRFFKDWGPTLLSLYIVFGTSFGKFARGLISLVIKSTVRLGAAVAALAVKVGIGKAGGRLSKVAGFLGGRKGKLLATGLEAGVTVAGTMALSNVLKGDGEEQPKAQGLVGGGYVKPKLPAFSGGGFNFNSMMNKGSMVAPFGSSGESSGFVSGEKGVDKVPAMLSDGEFVMSRGAVAKYGVDTLESMNAAGGGTNKPKILGGSTYAAGGGLIGENPDPNYKDPLLDRRLDLIKSLENYAKVQTPSGGNINLISAINNLSSSLKGQDTSNVSGSGKVPTGSLLTNPLGAIQRITGIKSGGIKMPELPKIPGFPSGGIKMPELPKIPGLPSGGIKMPGLPGPIQEVLDKLKGPGAATYRDAGSIYAKQMLGGFGGPVSEMDLSKDSRLELQKAIQRAKKRTGSEIRKVEGEIQKLKGMGAKDGNPALERQKSFLEKLKKGGIRVQYTDYADEKGQMSESAKNAKNILGQFWAYERDKKQGGGYRVEDKYDFDMFKKKVKDPKTGKMGERDFTKGELWNEGFLGKGKTTQQRLQALYLLNPLRGKGDVDMVLGGKRTAAESWGLSGSKTLLGGMLGVSGKPKDKNTKALEAKRPWWDKAGWFGGGSRVSQEKAKQAQIARSKPKALPVKPPKKPTVIMQGQSAVTMYSKNDPRRKNTRTTTPSFSATNPKASNSKAKVLNVRGGK